MVLDFDKSSLSYAQKLKAKVKSDEKGKSLTKKTLTTDNDESTVC